jgi:hypothetical protein
MVPAYFALFLDVLISSRTSQTLIHMATPTLPFAMTMGLGLLARLPLQLRSALNTSWNGSFLPNLSRGCEPD